MSEQPDDTSEHTDAPPVADDKKSRRSYYYDDATNYEIYDPAKDDEEEERQETEVRRRNKENDAVMGTIKLNMHAPLLLRLFLLLSPDFSILFFLNTALTLLFVSGVRWRAERVCAGGLIAA